MGLFAPFVAVTLLCSGQARHDSHSDELALQVARSQPCHVLRSSTHVQCDVCLPQDMALREEVQRLLADRIARQAFKEHQDGRCDKAISILEAYSAVSPDPSGAVAFGLGIVLQDKGRILESANAYQLALSRNPAHTEATLNLAALHHRFGDINVGIHCYKAALSRASDLIGKPQKDVRPESVVMIRSNLGLALRQTGRFEEALEQHLRTLSLLGERRDSWADQDQFEVEIMRTKSHIYQAKQTVCDWSDRHQLQEDLLQDVRARLAQDRPIDTILPFDSLGIAISQDLRHDIAVAFSSHNYQRQAGQIPWLTPLGPSGLDRLHIGYLSHDFNDHPTAYLAQGLFIFHGLPVSAFSYGKDDGSPQRRRIASLVGPGRFYDLTCESHEDAVKMIRRAEPHIIIDLQGHTLGQRTEILAARVAPVQASYLVFPGTSGAPFIDYLIADRFVLPAESAAPFYTERLLYLPHSYQVNHDPSFPRNMPGMTAAASTAVHRLRLENSLPLNAIVLANFNKADKLEPTIWHVWMSIMRRLPRSVLWLLKPHFPQQAANSTSGNAAMANLRTAAAIHGVSHERLIFADRVSRADHYRRQAAADLFLDTYLYGAHSTATDSLRAGLPVLTCPGESFPQRVGLSLLSNLQSQELLHTLTAPTLEDYEEVAVRLLSGPRMGKHLAFIERLKQNLRAETKGSLLYDTKNTTWNLERAAAAMWEARSNQGDSQLTYHVVLP